MKIRGGFFFKVMVTWRMDRFSGGIKLKKYIR